MKLFFIVLDNTWFGAVRAATRERAIELARKSWNYEVRWADATELLASGPEEVIVHEIE